MEATTKDGTVDFRGQPAIKSRTGGWSTSPYILGTQAFATVGYAGVSTNLILYLTNVLHEGNAAAANNVSNWIGTSYVTSLIGGFLADAYWGRYWTTAIFLVINFPHCYDISVEASEVHHQRALSWCFASFGADQFDKEDEKEQSQATTFFSWYYLSITVGATVSGLVLVYVEDKLSWGLGFGISMAADHKTAGNPLTRVAQVLVAATRKLHLKLPSDSSFLHEVEFKGSAIQGSRKIQHTDSFLFLDRAAIETDAETDGRKDPWRLCTCSSNKELQWTLASGSSRYHQRPYTQSLSRKFTGNPKGLTTLQRMGAGLIVSILAVVCAAGVEIFRLRTAKEHGLMSSSQLTGTPTVPISVLWQIPQYFLVGASEVFTYIGQLDFFYEQSPDAVRGLGVSLSLTSYALGNYVSTLVVTLVMSVTTRDGKAGWIPNNLNKGHLDYFFWLFAALSFINLLAYLACASWYTYIRFNKDSDAEEL